MLPQTGMPRSSSGSATGPMIPGPQVAGTAADADQIPGSRAVSPNAGPGVGMTGKARAGGMTGVVRAGGMTGGTNAVPQRRLHRS